jgi:hypothetical protein
MLFITCNRDKGKVWQSGNLFSGMSRSEQLAACARCHPTQFENEIQGPHFNAVKNLYAHQSFVNSNKYDCDFYTRHVNREVNNTCLRCHAPENLFETIFSSYKTHSDSLQALWANGAKVFPLIREDKSTHQTGVDCMSCHYDGQNILAGPNFKANPDLTPNETCKPVTDAFFASDYACLSCHTSNMVSPTAIYHAGITANTDCKSCHQEYDDKGKGTHYYYWRHGNKSKPRHLRKVYDITSAKLSGDEILVELINNYMPHQMGSGPEYVMKFFVENKNNKRIELGTKYFNRKVTHDETMFNAMEGNFLGGNAGINPIYAKPEKISFSKQSIALGKNSRLIVQLYSKGQYWFNDSLATFIEEETVYLTTDGK